MRKTILSVFMFVLMTTLCNAEIHREVLEMKASCVSEDIMIKIRADLPLQDGEYTFVNCTRDHNDKWEWWRCGCFGQDTIPFDFHYEKNNTYDIVSQYYTAPLEEVTDKEPGQINPSPIEMKNNVKKRTDSFSNIIYIPPLEPEKEPEEEKGFIQTIIESVDRESLMFFGILGGVLMVGVVLIIFFMIKREWSSADEKVPEKELKGKPPPGFTPLSEDEINDCINRYT